MPNQTLSCRVLAVGARGDLLLPHSLAGLEVVWTTAAPVNGTHYDLYVLDSAASVRLLRLYRKIREKDRNVAVILLCAYRGLRAIQEKTAGDPATFVAARDSATGVRQLVDRVIASAHSRAMAARVEEARAVMENLNERGERLAERSRNWQRRLTSRAWLALRAESMKLFQQHGGTAAQFEQLWPGVCHEALHSAGAS